MHGFHHFSTAYLRPRDMSDQPMQFLGASKWLYRAQWMQVSILREGAFALVRLANVIGKLLEDFRGRIRFGSAAITLEVKAANTTNMESNST